MRWMLLAAAGIIGYQILCPPVIGLADQGDFRRVIGKFGYGPEKPVTYYEFVALKYVPDPAYRWPEWEQFSSEDIFVGTALVVNSVVSKDGKLDIRIIGTLHALAFLAPFALLLHVTRNSRVSKWLWIVFLLVATDVARVLYFNTFYAEPASYIFCIFLLAETIGICTTAISTPRLARWCLWAALFVLAKPANAPLGLLLAAFAVRLGWPSKLAWAGAAAILSAAAFMILTAPAAMKDVNTYDLVFLSVLPESKNPTADMISLGLDPGLTTLSGTGAWSPNSLYTTLRVRGVIGGKVTMFTVLRFYITHPARMWRHIRRDLEVAALLRPPLGNFDRSSGLAGGSQSGAFALWSYFHEHVLVRRARILFLLLPVPAIGALVRRLRSGSSRLTEECFGLLGLCCMLSFLTVSFGSPWETVKHMLIFNVLLDACLVCTITFAVVAVHSTILLRRVSTRPSLVAAAR